MDVSLRESPTVCLPALKRHIITVNECLLIKLNTSLVLEGALVLIRQQFVWLSLSGFTWWEWEFLIELEGKEKGNQWPVSHEQGGTAFCLQKGKGGVHIVYTRPHTDTYIHTQHHCADWVSFFFFFLITENKVSPLPSSSSPLFPCRANEAVYSTPYWHSAKISLAASKCIHSLFSVPSTDLHLHSLQTRSFLLWFFHAFGDDTNEMLNY